MMNSWLPPIVGPEAALSHGDRHARRPGTIRLKHALAVVAEERGYPSWTEMKTALEHMAWESTAWYARGMDVFLNRWFTSYDQARAARATEGGYLLPYRNQFFICPRDAVRLLGLDPDDQDWARVAWDCARPSDPAAFDRLREKVLAHRRDLPGERKAGGA
jgi:hypothetical protein